MSVLKRRYFLPCRGGVRRGLRLGATYSRTLRKPRSFGAPAPKDQTRISLISKYACPLATSLLPHPPCPFRLRRSRKLDACSRAGSRSCLRPASANAPAALRLPLLLGTSFPLPFHAAYASCQSAVHFVYLQPRYSGYRRAGLRSRSYGGRGCHWSRFTASSGGPVLPRSHAPPSTACRGLRPCPPGTLRRPAPQSTRPPIIGVRSGGGAKRGRESRSNGINQGKYISPGQRLTPL